jgi:hypothetical protein
MWEMGLKQFNHIIVKGGLCGAGNQQVGEGEKRGWAKRGDARL